MSKFQDQIIDNVFPEERRRFMLWLIDVKRKSRNWLIIFTIIFVLFFFSKFFQFSVFVITHHQQVFNCIIGSFLFIVIVLPFLWPQKPGDIFSDNFKSGLNPRIWEYEGSWRVELDESGKTVLSITNSERGGLAIPCLSWSDYELQFDTRIINKVSAWTIRTSSLNDCVMFQLFPKFLRPHYHASGYWFPQKDISHNLSIEEIVWYPIRIFVRGAWVTIYIKFDKKQHLIYQNQILNISHPFRINLQAPNLEESNITSVQTITPSFRIGSFGFRLSSDESAQFRNIKAYRLS